MNRVTDYIRFSVCFVGLGYIVLWPWTAHDGAIAALEASWVCGSRFITEAICRLPQPMTLSPGLHLLGLLSAIAVVALCMLRRLARLGRFHQSAAVAVESPVWRLRRLKALARMSREPDPVAPTSCRPAPAANKTVPVSRRWVKPRREFGLRGVPH